MTEACTVGGCGRRVWSRGWCTGHYQRWATKGDLQADKPIRERRANFASVGCSVAACEGRHYAHGLCRFHENRRHRGQQLDAPFRLSGYKPGSPCIAPDCQRPSIAAGLCSTHYSRRQRTGTIAPPAVRSEEEKAAARERRREYDRRWKANEYRTRRESVLARRKAWMRANPERMREIDRQKQRRRSWAAKVPFSGEALNAKVAYWGSQCWVCRGPFEAIDHVKPLAKGGPHMLANLRPICTACNSRKRDRWPLAS